MSRPELINKLKAKHPKLNKLHLETAIDILFQCIEKALQEERSVQLRGFGTFFVKEIKEKFSARNPKTGDLIYVPKKKKIKFRATREFNQYLNQ